MIDDLLSKVEAFKAESGLSDHRVGIVLARDGRLLERLRDGRRVWPEKAVEIRESIERECSQRGLSKNEKGAA